MFHFGISHSDIESAERSQRNDAYKTINRTKSGNRQL